VTARHGTQDLQADLLKELNIAQGVTKREKERRMANLDALRSSNRRGHLMVFDYMPMSRAMNIPIRRRKTGAY